MQLNPDRLTTVIAYAKQLSAGKPRLIRAIDRATHLLREGRWRYDNRTGTLTVCGSGQELYIATPMSCQCRAFTEFKDGCCRHRIAVRLLRLYHDAVGVVVTALATAASRPEQNATAPVALSNENDELAASATDPALAANVEEPGAGETLAPRSIEPTTHGHYCYICGYCWNHSDGSCTQADNLICLDCLKVESTDSQWVCSACNSDTSSGPCLEHPRAKSIELTSEQIEQRELSQQWSQIIRDREREIRDAEPLSEADIRRNERETAPLIKRPIKRDVKVDGCSI
jgi:hypothetical protein